MECYDDNVKKSIFKSATTYQNDYKRYCDYKREFYEYQQDKHESPPLKTAKHSFDDHETFAKWREGVHIPFDLLVPPKPILNTHPSKPFNELEPLPVKGQEDAIKTRPRVYMIPSVSLDDIENEDMRKFLVNQMYTTTWRIAEKEATASFKKIIPSISTIESKDTVKLKIEYPKPIEQRFRKLGRKWDDKQIRGFADPTTEFWLHKDPPVVCGACVNPLKYIVPDEKKEIISQLIAKEQLRLPHDTPSPSYEGYRPMIALSVPLAKEHTSAVHPYLSTDQTLCTRYNVD